MTWRNVTEPSIQIKIKILPEKKHGVLTYWQSKVLKKLGNSIVEKQNKPTRICCEAYNMAANIVCYCTSLLIAVNDKKTKYHGQHHKKKDQTRPTATH